MDLSKAKVKEVKIFSYFTGKCGSYLARSFLFTKYNEKLHVPIGIRWKLGLFARYQQCQYFRTGCKSKSFFLHCRYSFGLCNQWLLIFNVVFTRPMYLTLRCSSIRFGRLFSVRKDYFFFRCPCSFFQKFFPMRQNKKCSSSKKENSTYCSKKSMGINWRKNTGASTIIWLLFFLPEK